MQIHPTAEVYTQHIGEGTVIWQFAVVLDGAVIGIGCNLNCHTFVENDVCIGNYVTLKSGVYLWNGITLEDYVFVGPNATFVNNPYPRSRETIDACQYVVDGHTVKFPRAHSPMPCSSANFECARVECSARFARHRAKQIPAPPV